MKRFLQRIAGSVRKGRDGGGMLERYKAHVIGEGVEPSALAPEDGAQKAFGAAGALEPPLPFHNLVMLLLTSNSLRQNIDALVTNIAGFGWRPVPTIDVFGADAPDVVREFHTSRGREIDADAAARLAKEWRREAARERDRLLHFFEFVNPEATFEEIRKRSHQDKELLGNAAWEMVRNRVDDLALISHVPFVTMRLMPLDEHAIDVTVPQKIDAVTLKEVEIRKRFRRYVQVQDNVTVYFKELGDPRLVSSRTGERHKSIEAMRRAEGPDVRPATEMLHFALHAPNESYGYPRYVGTLPEIIGSRMASEVNVLYFENKSVPPLVMLVSGGRVAADSIKRIRSFIENHVKGEQNFHNILIVEAEAEGDAKNAGRAQIKIQPLTEAMHQDALFQRYDRNNIDKIGASFRLPGMLRGDIRELNRATAEVAKSLAEEQVFEPERRSFDDVMNRRILPRLGIRFWEFRTNAPAIRDPSTLSTMIAQLVANGIVMPGEARKFVPEILGRDLPRCEEEFLKKPLRLTLAETRAKAQRARGETPDTKADLTTEELAERGGLLVPEQRDAPSPSDGKERRRRLRELLPLAENAAMLRRLIQTIELREDLGDIPADELRAMIENDGSRDPEPAEAD